ncbi:glutamate synthase (NADPH/NADH) small chain [Clostridium acetobutylicum]|uniref:NADPH-dependent glutamate synthase beta chain n=1 Tax=Clostridium acetobutylicum (strain ATCC 824 / DSM 792 / JCM 1419 / IAM 19013 / LMG 5710 / NBRC 13948 / NRRL B-527 / VKM B-1787 / 2291 / W) TaxID=272562 RepID=Q97L02_CLOAB|nr:MULTISPECIES: NAD(P)-dependent oxidoreductase [Clostridium]AAK78740.1 NADPH-dependent glutamate synthase beta chain [Clostridium acetobutylicum ATCC 824]ADZ19814.1 putative oxidoreductase [Clostridium acetobutylicum EA 2018]AEI34575.1 putative oxidoreductase [Clostridium acetobutylicum DSM 1731]AWV80458.1 NAD(P)-dependent oxidoreductase [Clostridium acetobutylicum]KHD37487.1 dihydropyrimidine dehydrogenase [Clostridium acetobutylicum]
MDNPNLLSEEANRCLLCKNPRCKANCPINTPIPEIISLYKEGKIMEAGEILFNNNPLSVICSLVCIHEDQCKGNCVRGIKSEPIKFHEIEEEISEKYLKEAKLKNVQKDKDRIAIVGGGPAGITVAFVLANKGYNVTIFEAHDKIGGVLRYGIPEYRLTKKLVDKLEERLIEVGVKIRPNTVIGPVISLDRLLEDSYKAVFIGTGVWNPKTLDVKGETLGNVHFAIDYLKSPESYRLGKKVAVIGAGNVAMDAARTAKRNGAEVTILYRKSFNEMPASKQEIRETKEDGVEFKLFRAPIEITEEGIKVAFTENVTDAEGKIRTKIIEGKEEFFECDSVVVAVSQAPKDNIVSNTTGLDTKWGLIVTDEKGNTTKKGTFACGDVVTGAKTVVEAAAQAKVVAETIDEYCKNN